MRELATRIHVSGPHLVDTCGTGGDGAHTFNISTAAAFVVAAAGGQSSEARQTARYRANPVAPTCWKRRASALELTPEQVVQCVSEIGVGFLFAPKFHSAMKHAIGPRREMGVRTVFNLLGPLTNPASAPNQVIGVFPAHWVEPLAEVLQKLGSEHVLVVHAEDGMDEISIGAPTRVAELKDGRVRVFTIQPEQFGFARGDVKNSVSRARRRASRLSGLCSTISRAQRATSLRSTPVRQFTLPALPRIWMPA